MAAGADDAALDPAALDPAALDPGVVDPAAVDDEPAALDGGGRSASPPPHAAAAVTSSRAVTARGQRPARRPAGVGVPRTPPVYRAAGGGVPDTLGTVVVVRLQEFWSRMESLFGSMRAQSVARDHVFGALGSRTAVEAIDAGVPVRTVWLEVCKEFDVPPKDR